MHDVVVLGVRRLGRGLLHEFHGILDDGRVVFREVEVLLGELVDDGVDLDDCGVDSVRDQGSGGGSNSESACGRSVR